MDNKVVYFQIGTNNGNDLFKKLLILKNLILLF